MALMNSRPPPAPEGALETGTRARRGDTDAAGASGTPLIGGRYRVQQELGRGGMGVVYQVRDAGSQQDLALKQLRVPESSSAHAPRLRMLFEREFHVLAQLAHPRVIAVYDYGLDPVGPFYTMELLDGGDLKALAPLDFGRACRLLFEVCSSLALLHSRRLVHRDVSPRNVRCTRDGHAKLIDFGAMVPMGPCSHIVGTPAFIAPEVLHHANLDARTDLFSLGATLYYTLTGRAPFAARQLSDLREAWSREPVPPSHFAPAIPPALDALCAALLRIDPAQRPRSAFEVMQRLEGVAGIEQGEPIDVSQAYLTTPALVGRDDALRGFRQRMRHALHAQGGALCFASTPGLGRSRLLDTCALEAKTLGATVLRAGASTQTPFAAAEQLAAQLLQALPDAALAASEESDTGWLLLPPASDGPARLRALSDRALEHGALQTALTAWIARMCTSHAILIAVDDVERVDEASLSLLAALALQAQDLRLLLLVTRDSDDLGPVPPALSVLSRHCITSSLRALTRKETEALLGSVFGDVPHLPLLADRLYRAALGNPRESLALAQHLIAAGSIRYDGGQWTLPAELDAHALPQSAADAFTARVLALPALARRLAETQALLGAGTLRAEDYAALAPEATPAELDAALSALLAREVVQSDGELYSLSHRALIEALRGLLDDAQKRERHLALYELYRRKPGVHPDLVAHHLIEAGRTEQALDLLAQSAALLEQTSTDAIARSNPQQLATTLERALALAVSSGRPAREAHELRRRLCLIAVVTDVAVHQRFAPAWLAQLELDSGLADYRALPDTLEPGARLQQAIAAAVARHAASPEQARVYRVDEAIKHLALYVATSIVVVMRAFDRRALSGLPDILEPFAPLTPALSALWQNALALKEVTCLGRLLRARRRWGEVYERLDRAQGEAIEHVEAIRNAVIYAIGNFEATLGRPAAFEWAEKLDADPQQRVGAMHIRRIACSMQGDTEGAARYSREGELLALRTSARAMFDQAWVVDLFASVVTRDLPGIKRVIDGITPLAARHPGWLPQLRVAEGDFQLLCGDAEGARRAFEEARLLAEPQADRWLMADMWIAAVSGLVTALTELGRTAEAIGLGERALAICAEHEVELLQDRIACMLALAEAKHGLLERATARVERSIEDQTQRGVTGIALAANYEARARIAIAARDAGAATHFAALAVRARGGERRAATVNLGPLVEEARRVGVEIALTPTDFEASVLGTSRSETLDPAAVRLWEALEGCASASSRAMRALELLCEFAHGGGGQLYLVGKDAELELAATRNAAPPDADARRFARGFFAQQLDDVGMTAGLTQATRMLSLPGAAAYIDARGTEHRLLILSCKERGALVYVGLAVLDASSKARMDPMSGTRLTALAAYLLRAGDTPGKRLPDAPA